MFASRLNYSICELETRPLCHGNRCTPAVLSDPFNRYHPLEHLQLVAWRISGDSTRVLEFLSRYPDSSYQHGARVQTRPTSQHGGDGIASCEVGFFIDILADLYQQGLQHRTINVVRSAVSMTHRQMEGTPIGQHPMVSKLSKGVYNSRPPKPSYSVTWSVDKVLT